jgi:signal transduction histidine kinase/DNA-binding response OmpR family regulator
VAPEPPPDAADSTDERAPSPSAPSLRGLLLVGGSVGLAGPLVVAAAGATVASPALALAAGLAVCLLVVMLALAGGWWLSRRLETLADATEQATSERPAGVDADDLAADVEPDRWPAELARLGRSVLTLGERRRGQTAEDVEAGAALASHARRLEAVQDATHEILRELDLAALLETIVARAVQLVGGASGSIELWDPEAERLTVRAFYRLDRWMLTRRLKLGQGIGGLAAQRREGVVVNHYRSWLNAEDEVLRRTRITAVLAEPIISDEQLIGVLLIHHDSPDRRFSAEDQATVRMFAAGAALAIRNTARYQAEAAAREEACATAAARGELLATMSHEIRTLMSGVIGMTELLLRSSLDDRQREQAETIRASGEALLTVVDDVLDYAKIEAGTLSIAPRPFDPLASVDAVVRLLAPRAAERGLVLTSQVDPSVPRLLVGDEARIRQIMLSLVGNALKFTERGSVVIDVTCQDQPIGRPADRVTLMIAVHDTGIGIPAEQLVQLFERFARADGSTMRRYGGIGLELAVSKRLVERMGGEIGAESEVGKGSTFWVRLPLEPTSRPASPPASPPARAPAEPAEPAEPPRHENGPRGSPDRLGPAARPATAVSKPDSFPPAPPSATCEGSTKALTPALSQREREFPAPLAPTHGRERGSRERESRETRSGFEEAVGGSTASGGEEGEGHEATPARVLVVEDDPIGQRVTLHVVRRLGYAVDVVADGQAAIEAVAANGYALVLMDCQMPGVDGYTTAAEIRRREAALGPGARRVAIVALTASVLDGDRARCLAADMDDYLTKPIDGQRLAALLERWVPGHDTGPETGSESGPPGQSAPSPEPGVAEAPELRPAPESPVLDSAGPLGSGTTLGPHQLEVVELFFQEAPRRLTALTTAAAQGDRGQVARLAHTLAGSASSLGAARLAAACARLEALARDDREPLSEAIELVREELRLLEAALTGSVAGRAAQAEPEDAPRTPAGD